MDALLLGLSLGLGAGLAPGPLLALVIRSALQDGIAAGVRVALSPLVTDVPVIVVAVVLASSLPEGALGVLAVAGGGFVIWLGVDALRASPAPAGAALCAAGPRRDLLRGALTNALSPHPWMFWITVGAPILAGQGAGGGALFLGAFYLVLIGSKVAGCGSRRRGAQPPRRRPRPRRAPARVRRAPHRRRRGAGPRGTREARVSDESRGTGATGLGTRDLRRDRRRPGAGARRRDGRQVHSYWVLRRSGWLARTAAEGRFRALGRGLDALLERFGQAPVQHRSRAGLRRRSARRPGLVCLWLHVRRTRGSHSRRSRDIPSRSAQAPGAVKASP